MKFSKIVLWELFIIQFIGFGQRTHGVNTLLYSRCVFPCGGGKVPHGPRSTPPTIAQPTKDNKEKDTRVKELYSCMHC